MSEELVSDGTRRSSHCRSPPWTRTRGATTRTTTKELSWTDPGDGPCATTAADGMMTRKAEDAAKARCSRRRRRGTLRARSFFDRSPISGGGAAAEAGTVASQVTFPVRWTAPCMLRLQVQGSGARKRRKITITCSMQYADCSDPIARYCQEHSEKKLFRPGHSRQNGGSCLHLSQATHVTAAAVTNLICCEHSSVCSSLSRALHSNCF